eukprot:TRINITY_DN6524_c0_g2_i1.p1 TRINITY_DN6524_c0_g2~~TRINITY_DN6524_c0_g2_i1.p1  ORF type:complete len:827 (+),score=184.53 TRINITY_DN6524_c0_g2_i1:244-2481(+)
MQQEILTIRNSGRRNTDNDDEEKEDLKRQLSAARKDIDRLKSKEATAKLDLDTSQQQIRRLQKTLNEQSHSVPDSDSDLKNKLAITEQHLEEAEGEILHLRKKLAGRKSDKNDPSDYRERYHEAQEQLRSREKELSRLRNSQHSSGDTDQNILREKLVLSEEHLQASEEEVMRLKKQLAATRQSDVDSHRDDSILRARLSDVTNQLEASEHQLQRLREAENDNDILRERLGLLEEELANREKELHTNNNNDEEILKLKKKLAASKASERTQQALQESLDVTEKGLQDAKDEIERLRLAAAKNRARDETVPQGMDDIEQDRRNPPSRKTATAFTIDHKDHDPNEDRETALKRELLQKDELIRRQQSEIERFLHQRRTQSQSPGPHSRPGSRPTSTSPGTRSDRDRKGRDKDRRNYPEFGLCLSDTLPRPVLRGRSGRARSSSATKQKRVEGIKVVGVRGPAKKAGILPEDSIKQVNDTSVPDLIAFKNCIASHPPKKPVSFTVERGNEIYEFVITPNASASVPGHQFQRLVWLQRDEIPEIDIDRLAAPKGQYYDHTGKLHPLYDDDYSHASRRSNSQSPVPSRQNSISPRRSVSPTEGRSPRRPHVDPVGCENSWTWGTDVSPPRNHNYIPTDSSTGTGTGTGYPPQIKVGARVKRNPSSWQWGDQDGGEGNLGTVAKVDSLLGWVTVRWDATGRGSTYRWGKDNMYDVDIVEHPSMDQPPAPRARPGQPHRSSSSHLTDTTSRS